MDMGGRNVAYQLMDMEVPATILPPASPPAPKIVIDRTGESDPGRYKGVKMTNLDDDAIGAALQAAQERSKRGEELRTKIEEENYIQPFAGEYVGRPSERKLGTELK